MKSIVGVFSEGKKLCAKSGISKSSQLLGVTDYLDTVRRNMKAVR